MNNNTLPNQAKLRCSWANKDELYQNYHDYEWGKELKNDLKLFELLCLEGQQAGLSWYTILKKREGYRQCFAKFDPITISQFTAADIEKLMHDNRIIKNNLKIHSIINNAQAYLKIIIQQSFTDFLWEVVNDQPIINHWQNIEDVPTETKLSIELSKKLKQAGFKFVGPTICYAFMQACGMVNDHFDYCFCKTSQKNSDSKDKNTHQIIPK